MLPKGSIAKIYEYYFTTPRYNEDVLRAMREFFDRPDLDRGGSLEINDKSEGLFNEWFLYDFELTSGQTPLANFIEENPLQLSKDSMVLYRSILKSNIYGMFEVLHVDIDKGLMLKNLQTGKEIYVYERKLTFQIRIGGIFFGRIGLVDDHNELVGADTFSIDGLDDAVKKELRKAKFVITPKVAHDIWKNQ